MSRAVRHRQWIRKSETNDTNDAIFVLPESGPGMQAGRDVTALLDHSVDGSKHEEAIGISVDEGEIVDLAC